MTTVKPIKQSYRNAEIIANWMLRFDGHPEKLQEAEELCILNGLEPGQLKRIIDGEYVNYHYSDILTINKYINRRGKCPKGKKTDGNT